MDRKGNGWVEAVSHVLLSSFEPSQDSFFAPKNHIFFVLSFLGGGARKLQVRGPGSSVALRSGCLGFLHLRSYVNRGQGL